ncbi:3-deoxy-7-phosphoheptulonate synthase [Burkholderia singularis]|uniref:Phospho-2-dehydro-3-deoxyheptonate aldolase n=1 Tax=Burkholderia singularis TaxID=1503053 RepID=A0A238H2C5_9BURK|nr:3-deoxy-7-phosphoheptulonate synthase [Burkholderia singularis]SMF99345.1 2-keto-3-deoxy-D-arabino-heptulosonate-7-phosphate synthase I alpha [Burkholderia singularis]
MSLALRDREAVTATKIVKPAMLKEILPRGTRQRQCVIESRRAIAEILHGASDRLLAIVGPCSVHDPHAALEFAEHLVDERRQLADDIELVMRVYFEKPRTTIGWKGLINDPLLDGSFEIERGLQTARQLMLDITGMGLPIAVEFLDLTTPAYLSDLVSWGAIGARTTQSQVHRELVSGLPCPVGFKNSTEGSVQVPIDAIRAANQPHRFLAVDSDGELAKVTSAGNRDCHLVLRGGKQPNYDACSIDTAVSALKAAGLLARVVVDASHGNSGKRHENQLLVCDSLAAQLGFGDDRIAGVMIESNLVEGRQDVEPGKPLVYGQSITDSCIGWSDTVHCLDKLAHAVRERRLVRMLEDAASVVRFAAA